MLYWNRVGPKCNDWYPYKETDFDTETQTEGRQPCEEGDRNWNDEATSQTYQGLLAASRSQERDIGQILP